MKTVDAFATELKELGDRIDRLEQSHASPADIDAAKILLSGLLPRQRIHWSQEIVHTDRLAVLATAGVWTLFLNNTGLEWSWRVALASGVSAVLIGLWRWYARSVDDAIAKLYPAIMRYEQALGIRANESALLGLRTKYNDSIDTVRQLVDEKRIGARGHLVVDWFAVVVISGMGACTIRAGDFASLRFWGSWRDTIHPYALLLVNVASVLFVFWVMNAYQTNGKTLERFRRGVRDAITRGS